MKVEIRPQVEIYAAATSYLDDGLPTKTPSFRSEALVVRVQHGRPCEGFTDHEYHLGWDRPAEIWRAMEEAVPSLICTGINLVTADGEIIMQVPDFANLVLIQELQNLKSAGWVGPCAERELCGMKIETHASDAQLQNLKAQGWTDEGARVIVAITEAKRSAAKLIEDEIRKSPAKQESSNA